MYTSCIGGMGFGGMESVGIEGNGLEDFNPRAVKV